MPISQMQKKASKKRDDPRFVLAAFARSVSSEMTRAMTLNYAEVVRAFRNLEKHYVAHLERYPKLAREIKRRVSERILEQAILHGCNLSVCCAKLRVASRLGFSDLEQKAHYHLLYAKAAFARGHKRLALRTTTAITKELERSLTKSPKNALAKHLLKVAREFLTSMKNSSGKLLESA
jgi:hypothetical protein